MSLFKKNINNKLFLSIFASFIIINGISADNTVGLILNDESQSFDGYTLFAPNTSTITYLIDNMGNLVHQWESEYVPALSAYLLEDGNLLRSAKIEHPTDPDNNPTGGFQKIDWEGNVLWEYYYGRQHHDVEPLPNGNVLLVTNDRKPTNDAIQAGRDPNLIDGNNIRSLSILEINQTGLETGEIVWQWNAWDHLIQDFDSSKDNFGVVMEYPELMNINFAKDGGQDWLHTNSLAYSEDLDQIIVSNRNTNEIWIIDHSTTTEQAASYEGGNSGKGGDLLYRWGNPFAYGIGSEQDQQLFGQHDAYWVASGVPGEGNIMIFNNGINRPNGSYSTIVEIVPPVDVNGSYAITTGLAYEPTDPLWNYSTPTPEDFNSPRYGGSQRLPNGNTLICNSDSGNFFELNQNDEIVWRYINPVTTDGILTQGTTEIDHNQVFRCYRYRADYPGLDSKDLTPGDPIELSPSVAVDNEQNIIDSFKLFDNYPNPFNPTTNIEFSLEKRGLVSLTIYDLIGNKIRTLANQFMEPGAKTIIWDSLDENNVPVSSGVYFYSLQAGQIGQTKKMILLR